MSRSYLTEVWNGYEFKLNSLDELTCIPNFVKSRWVLYMKHVDGSTDTASGLCLYDWILWCCCMWLCVQHSLPGGHQIPFSFWVITQAPLCVPILPIVETIKVGLWRSQKTINGAAELWLRARIRDERLSNSTTSFCQWNVCSPTKVVVSVVWSRSRKCMVSS
jgi:hypothetical protein